MNRTKPTQTLPRVAAHAPSGKAGKKILLLCLKFFSPPPSGGGERLLPDRFSGGFSLIKVMVIIAVVGGFFSMGNTVLPKLYDCYLLRDLANRVAIDYQNMSRVEVLRRVQFEIHRSRIVIPEDYFKILPLGHGYRVTIHYPIPLELKIGEKTFSWEAYKAWNFHYEVES